MWMNGINHGFRGWAQIEASEKIRTAVTARPGRLGSWSERLYAAMSAAVGELFLLSFLLGRISRRKAAPTVFCAASRRTRGFARCFEWRFCCRTIRAHPGYPWPK